MAEKRDPTIIALEAIYAALKDMDIGGQKKVLSSAFALLGVEGVSTSNFAPATFMPAAQSASTSVRPVGLIELINEKRPGTNAQRIAVFAYYRERTEGVSRFSRADLRAYFAKAKMPPAGNYDRDFGEAVRAGWIHEDGAESYLTSKGIEAIEAGFEGERKYKKGKKRAAGAKKKAARKIRR
jgi:hypothetical protein